MKNIGRNGCLWAENRTWDVIDRKVECSLLDRNVISGVYSFVFKMSPKWNPIYVIAYAKMGLVKLILYMPNVDEELNRLGYIYL
jgi:hypothetical protein